MDFGCPRGSRINCIEDLCSQNNPYDRVRGYQQGCRCRCTGHCAHILEVIFFVDVDGTLSDFMRTILVYLFCGWYGYPIIPEGIFMDLSNQKLP